MVIPCVSLSRQVRRIQELEAMLREREEEDDRRRREPVMTQAALYAPSGIVGNAFAGVVASAGGIPMIDPRMSLNTEDDDDEEKTDSASPRKSVRFAASPVVDDDDNVILSPTSSSQFDGILTRLSGHRHSSSAPAFLADATIGSLSVSTAEMSPTADGGKDDAAGAGGRSVVERDSEVADAVQRAETDFQKRQLAMERNIRDYERTILLKEDRLRALQVCSASLCFLQCRHSRLLAGSSAA